MTGGGDAVLMLRAVLAGQPYPPLGVVDTPANQRLWASVVTDVEAMPAGVLPDIPGDWAEMPDDEPPGSQASGSRPPFGRPGDDPAAMFNPAQLRDWHGRWGHGGGGPGAGEVSKSPQEIFQSISPAYDVGEGVTDEDMQVIAAGLGKVPAGVRGKMAQSITALRIQKTAHGGFGEPALGMFSTADGSLTVTPQDGAAVTAVHEGLHAADMKDGEIGAFSHSPGWRKAADLVRSKTPRGSISLYYFPVAFDDSQRDRGNEEMFAELAAQHLLGEPLTLDGTHPLPGAAARAVTSYLDGALR